MSTSQRWRLERGGHEVGTGGFAHAGIDQGAAPGPARGGGGRRRGAGGGGGVRSRAALAASFAPLLATFPPAARGSVPPAASYRAAVGARRPCRRAGGRILPPGRKWRELRAPGAGGGGGAGDGGARRRRCCDNGPQGERLRAGRPRGASDPGRRWGEPSGESGGGGGWGRVCLRRPSPPPVRGHPGGAGRFPERCPHAAGGCGAFPSPVRTVAVSRVKFVLVGSRSGVRSIRGVGRSRRPEPPPAAAGLGINLGAAGAANAVCVSAGNGGAQRDGSGCAECCSSAGKAGAGGLG